jgi:hypothetical protein
VTAPSSQPLAPRKGRSLTGLYVAIGVVVALGLLGAWWWTAWNHWWFDAAEAQRGQASSESLSNWGDPVYGIKCRVLSCHKVKDQDKDYPERLVMTMAISNTGGKDLEMWIGGEDRPPMVDIGIRRNGVWEALGNARKLEKGVGEAGMPDLVKMPSHGTVQVRYSIGLTKADVKEVESDAALCGRYTLRDARSESGRDDFKGVARSGEFRCMGSGVKPPTSAVPKGNDPAGVAPTSPKPPEPKP